MHKHIIIGHGDIAGALKKLPNDPKMVGWIFFASGVSNSGEKRESEYQREAKLLLSQNKKAHIIYFSSLAVFYSDTRYALHKRQMEGLIKLNFKHYTIMRMGNITWGDNPNTIINYFRDSIEKGKKIDVWDTRRYIVGKEEFLHWINLIPSWNSEMNITGTMMKISEIVQKIKSGEL